MEHRPTSDAAVLIEMDQEDVRIYHFTDAANLPGILRSGGVNCKRSLPPDTQKIDVSHYDIQDKRRRKRVPCGSGGVLHDYVPFYFAARSPMMYVISRDGVDDCSSNTGRLVYLVSNLQRIREAGARFVFSDGHATKVFTKFYEEIADLDKVDWEVMRMDYWTDTDDDPDRMRRRQAEFLVHGLFPWNAVESLAVKTPNMKRRLNKYLTEEWSDHVKPIELKPDWYF